MALSAFYWACIVFTKLSTAQVARCVGRHHSSVVKTSRVVMAAAMFKQQQIPTDDLQESLRWIADNIKTLPLLKEVNQVRRHLRPVKVVR